MHVVMQRASSANGGALSGRHPSQSDRSDVDAYIASATAPARRMLRTLRAIVISEAPNAAERLSYGMPSYHYHGQLVYFAAHKEHIGVYGLAGLGAASETLRDYFRERGTLRFPFTSDLPTGALHAAVRARVRQNEAEALKTLADRSVAISVDGEVKKPDEGLTSVERFAGIYPRRSQKGD